MLAVVLHFHGSESIYQKMNTFKLEQDTLTKRICLTRIIKKCMDNNTLIFVTLACIFSKTKSINISETRSEDDVKTT